MFVIYVYIIYIDKLGEKRRQRALVGSSCSYIFTNQAAACSNCACRKQAWCNDISRKHESSPSFIKKMREREGERERDEESRQTWITHSFSMSFEPILSKCHVVLKLLSNRTLMIFRPAGERATTSTKKRRHSIGWLWPAQVVAA